MNCKCGSDKFGHFDDFNVEYDYCLVCNRMYDEQGNELQEGEPPEDDENRNPEDYQPRHPDDN